jgi:hypothetical protein
VGGCLEPVKLKSGILKNGKTDEDIEHDNHNGSRVFDDFFISAGAQLCDGFCDFADQVRVHLSER